MGKVHLPIFEASGVESIQSHFRCHPYSAVIRAEVCLKRQLRLVETGIKSVPGQSTKLQGDYEQCRGCTLGATVKSRLPKATVKVKPIGKTRFLPKKRGSKSSG